MDASRRRRAPLVAELPETAASSGPALPAGGNLRPVLRAVLALAWTLPCAVVQGVLLLLPGRGKVRMARLYWRGVCHILGMEVRVVGTPAAVAPGRAVVFAVNHSSWLDIPVLGGTLHGCFVAKGEIARWPVISVIARLGRTVFVSRGRDTLEAERAAMAARLRAGDNLILFPEGTSSDGARVLPFRSTFFSLAEARGPEGSAAHGAQAPVIQPVSLVYDRLGWLPTGRVNRPLFAWYGDMDLLSHYWRLARCSGMRATVVLHGSLDPAQPPALNRKQISQHAWTVVATGAASLRQNRPAEPRPAPSNAA